MGFLKRDKTVRTALKEAIRQSNLTLREKLTTRIILAFNPEVEEAVLEYIVGVAKTAGKIVTSIDGALAGEIWLEIVKLVLEHLPEILELIFKLIGGSSNGNGEAIKLMIQKLLAD